MCGDISMVEYVLVFILLGVFNLLVRLCGVILLSMMLVVLIVLVFSVSGLVGGVFCVIVGLVRVVNNVMFSRLCFNRDLFIGKCFDWGCFECGY